MTSGSGETAAKIDHAQVTANLAILTHAAVSLPTDIRVRR